MQVVGIDCGRSSVKVVSGDQIRQFPSIVGEARELRIKEGGEYIVEYAGQTRFVGNLAKESFSQREMATATKLHEETKWLFLTGLALVAKEPQLCVATGLPVEQHQARIKQELTEFLKGSYTVTVNKRKVSFEVVHMGVLVEGIGALFADSNRDIRGLNAVYRLLDIGSRTVNGIVVDAHGQYLDKESFSLNYGIIELQNAGENGENTEYLKEQFARRIVADVSKWWLTYKKTADVVILSGGGSLLLEKYLMNEYMVSQLTDNPVLDNAKGFYNMGVRKWREYLNP
jgi:hypothetical protein